MDAVDAHVCGRRKAATPHCTGVLIKDGKATVASFKQTQTVPPRNYIVAFSQKGLGPKYEHFCANLRSLLDEGNSACSWCLRA